MPFTLDHVLASEAFTPEQHDTPEGIFFTVSAEGTFDVLYPGRLFKQIVATVRHSMRIDTPDPTVPAPPGGIDTPGRPGFPTRPPHPRPLHNGVRVTVEGIPSVFQIFDPSGALFTRDEITLGDLKQFRDLRGTPRGRWRYTLVGRSRVYTLSPSLNESVGDPQGSINLALVETVPSSSASPLVPRSRVSGAPFRATFDLYRVGTFRATVSSAQPFGRWRGEIRLLDPDGVVIASSTSARLSCPIPLALLGRSRDAAGNPRQWTLEVVSRDGALLGAFVTATVLGEGRIGTAVLQERIQKLIGPRGSFLRLEGENRDGQMRAMLTITDVVAAETIDMHGLLDARLKKEGQSTNIEVDQPMVLYQDTSDFDYGISVDVSTVKLRSIDIEVGPGKGLGAATPTIRLRVRIDGRVEVKWNGLGLASARLRGGEVELEVGVQIDPDGVPRLVQWVPEDPFDIDMNNAVVGALVLALGVVGGVGAIGIAEYVEEIVNDRMVEGARDLFADRSLASRILMMILGTHLTYLPPRFEGSDILFEHVAPKEPDPKPRHGYSAAIGRSVLHVAAGRPTFMPRTLGDTWKADNLRAKVDHIVVVMMENRSYDHVLGYRAQAPTNDGADGLTPEMMEAIGAAAIAVQPLPPAEPGAEPLPAVHPLRLARFLPNEIGLRTRIPKGVGHELDDVEQQLAGRVDGPGGRKINDPRGFMENFREHRLGGNPEGEDGCTPFTVLGYYEKNAAADANDLPVTAFFAEHFSYCDRYFCSHPGPTLPNRMYSLTGDVQYDRLGVPILDNNHGDNFLLSRAPSIYDALTRNGVSWRVYESFPSVTMLRMFARYATDDVNIRPLEDLARDVQQGNLPALTVIEPAMHHYPPDDDHPPADMYRGQHFLRRVYETLRSNPQTWAKTLLIVTYDEHGGLYDHAIPPVADVLDTGRPDTVLGDSTADDDTPDRDPTGGATDVGGGMVLGTGAVRDVVMGGAAVSGAVLGAAFGGRGVRGFHVAPGLLDALVHVDAGTDPSTGLPPPGPIEIPYGVRVPTYVISPWVTPGKGPSIVLDHCSIIKTVLARFCGDTKPFLSDRVHASHSFESFLDATEPMADPGPAPALRELSTTALRRISGASAIVTPPLYRKRMRAEHVDYHDLSGRLARMLGR